MLSAEYSHGAEKWDWKRDHTVVWEVASLMVVSSMRIKSGHEEESRAEGKKERMNRNGNENENGILVSAMYMYMCT
jgi:hypothetical protein